MSTGIKFCGLTRLQDIEYANLIRPEYIGFVFWEKSRRKVDAAGALSLKNGLSDGISAVGVFVDEKPEAVAKLLNEGVIDIAQLHGSEDEVYIKKLRALTDKPLIKAFQIRTAKDAAEAQKCSADHILLDAGKGDGVTFDWELLHSMERPYFLAGGLDVSNVRAALDRLAPFAVDVSSGIETDGVKDFDKMKAFAAAVRGTN